MIGTRVILCKSYITEFEILQNSEINGLSPIYEI